ncbi:MAG: hypothetical protein KatS3mg059_1034 [Thermomicrobiales bacterium]|nr:MAG: hypothetical protein KatS3mg059_1034 [Thermomicrobiales bacterium]
MDSALAVKTPWLSSAGTSRNRPSRLANYDTVANEHIARSLADKVIPSRARDLDFVSLRRLPGHASKTRQTLSQSLWARFSIHVFQRIHPAGTILLVGGVQFFPILAKVAGVSTHEDAVEEQEGIPAPDSGRVGGDCQQLRDRGGE